MNHQILNIYTLYLTVKHLHPLINNETIKTFFNLLFYTFELFFHLTRVTPWIDLFVFNNISDFVGYVMPKPSLPKENIDGISPKVNVLRRL